MEIVESEVEEDEPEEEEEEELESLGVESISADEVEEETTDKKSPSPIASADEAAAPTESESSTAAAATVVDETDEAASESDVSTTSTANNDATGVLSCEVTIHTGDKSSSAASTASAVVVVGAPSVDWIFNPSIHHFPVCLLLGLKKQTNLPWPCVSSLPQNSHTSGPIDQGRTVKCSLFSTTFFFVSFRFFDLPNWKLLLFPF